jgi:parallel beta-helix repeat protein
MRWKLVGAAILLVGILLVVPASNHFSPATGVHPKSVSNHAPIRIIGDEQFDSMHGVNSGSGTVTDPYVIQGWNVDLSSAEEPCAAISVQSTTAYVAIRNIRIHSPSACDGVQISNVTNAKIEWNVLTAKGHAIAIRGSRSIMVLDNVIEGSLEGIVASDSRSILIQQNIVRRADQGIIVEDSSRVSTVGNVVANSTANGVVLLGSFNSTIDNNELTDTAFRGIALFNSSYAIVSRNVVSRTREECLYMNSGHGNILTGNFAEDCGWGGIGILDASGIIASANEVVHSPEAGISFADCFNSALIANKVSNTRFGIKVASNSDFNVVVNNTITSSVVAGIVLVASSTSRPDYNLIQGNTAVGSGEFDLEDLSDGKQNIWRLNTFSTAIVRTLP